MSGDEGEEHISGALLMQGCGGEREEGGRRRGGRRGRRGRVIADTPGYEALKGKGKRRGKTWKVD